MNLYYRPLLIAFITSVSVMSIRAMWNYFPLASSSPIGMPLAILISAILGALLYLRYDNHLGISNFILQIHEPPELIKKSSWIARSFISSILIFFGAPLGMGGPAMELSNYFTLKTRPLTSNWFESQRRTDTSVSLATGITAAFSAPLSGILIPLELHTGGNTLIVAVTVLFSFLFISLFEKAFGLGTLQFSSEFLKYEWNNLLQIDVWLGCLLIALTACFFSIALTQFTGLGRKSFDKIFNGKRIFIPITGAMLFFFIYLSSTSTQMPLHLLLDKLFFETIHPVNALTFFLSIFLGFTILSITFGSTGVYWPFFILGCILGSLLLGLNPAFTKITLLTGGAVFLGTILGTPLTASLLVYELSGSIIPAIPALFATLLANEIRKKLNQKTFFEMELQSAGLQIDNGRRHSILNSIKVKSVMDNDFIQVHERDSLQSLETAMKKSRYPFLPVSNSKGAYLGLLSTDLIISALKQQTQKLDEIIEAKDLLYRNSSQNKSVFQEDNLSVTLGLFTHIPVSAVLNQEKEIVGLLFAHSVRTAYDKEVSQRSLLITSEIIQDEKEKEDTSKKS